MVQVGKCIDLGSTEANTKTRPWKSQSHWNSSVWRSRLHFSTNNSALAECMRELAKGQEESSLRVQLEVAGHLGLMSLMAIFKGDGAGPVMASSLLECNNCFYDR